MSSFDRIFEDMDKLFDGLFQRKEGFFRVGEGEKIVFKYTKKGHLSVEYKVIETHEFQEDLEKGLNDLGKEGWELVVWDGSRAIFKRV